MSSPSQRRAILEAARTVAVLGAHIEPSRPAYYVPDYLHDNGYRIFPVNPGHVGMSLWGQPVRAKLTEIDEPIDMVDVFRRSEALPSHLDEILGMEPLPKFVWFQQGIANDDVAEILEAAGIEVIQDHCTLADHRAFGLKGPG